jgi:hypothetical protein
MGKYCQNGKILPAFYEGKVTGIIVPTWQIFDTNPHFGRFWKGFLTQVSHRRRQWWSREIGLPIAINCEPGAIGPNYYF